LQTPAPPGPSTWNPAPGWDAFHPGAPPQPAVDLDALSKFKVASIVALVSTAAGFLYPLVAGALGYYTVSVPTGGGTPTIHATALYGVAGAIVFGAALSLVSLAVLRSGFVRLRPVDGRFESTPTFVLLAMIAYVLIAIGFVALVAVLVQIVNCIGGATTVPPGCVNAGGLLGGIALLGIGGIILLIGGIGTIIGIWRLGDRYHDGVFKAAAILWIFIGLVGAILTLIAVSRAERMVRSAPPAPSFAAAPFVPPPPMPPR
jgi:MFS family permease